MGKISNWRIRLHKLFKQHFWSEWQDIPDDMRTDPLGLHHFQVRQCEICEARQARQRQCGPNGSYYVEGSIYPKPS